mmetsp:Transcript_8070/g.10767  ORF Transcript_8070/g.10767 Transcript_8070/m.10767 type:complete len:706 (+) Transcript_8070:66-2183(+)|eukprot:CAMPEP_0201482222 /NCGR_PEP_ID=MMETSP0151_2-20130828/6490_1 /ASSEMBLY_ACC=CAM_ASM_000257 /TAXON_ID=200890 /ORGANISM="Paramoeba atlantica, Strain 621/1 / CCAP 1560/9" /LENGTH=705 /DNA_ID=CAMNT_0047864813 /DNA_START=73 /DNA_END=2190 /DNA_ORIENTATION=+
MGQNPCKPLVEHGGRISEADLKALVERHDIDKKGALSPEQTEKFISELSSILGVAYDKHNTARIVNRCDTNATGFLSLKSFQNLFAEAVKEVERAELAKKAAAEAESAESQGPSSSSVASSSSAASTPEHSSPAPKASSAAAAAKPAPAAYVSSQEPTTTPKQRRYNEAFAGSSRIDRDEIQLGKLIGKGNFGKVYAGTCRGTEVAIKIPNVSLGGVKFDLLLNELEVMKKANSPYVCIFMGACHDQSEDKVLIVMEKMFGDAEKRSKDKDFTLVDRLHAILHACKGQAWLHESSCTILHLDLKPSNILYDERGVFKVCDFGLSTVLPEGEQTLFMRRMRGTPIYMAPEIMIPGKHPISHKSDTYSMAITAWEILTGQNCFKEYRSLPPFKRDVHGNKKRPPLPDNWPESLKSLLRDMWDPDPNVRPSFKEMVERLNVIIPETEVKVHQEALRAAIRDDQGAEWWEQQFPGKLKVPLDEFLPRIMDVLQVNEDSIPSEWAHAHLEAVSIDNLKGFAEKGALQKSAVETELHRRNESGVICGPRDQTKETISILIGTTLHGEKGVVEATRFGQLLAYFGPFEPALATRMEELARQNYFHGFMDSKRAEALVINAPKGTFLARLSNNRWGQVIITIKGDSLKHLIVQNVDRKFRYKTKEDRFWSSVPALIEDHQALLDLRYPEESGPFRKVYEAVQIGGYDEGDFED